MALGMSLTEVVKAATAAPARALRRNELGTLRVGAAGDATIIEEVDGNFIHTDALGETITAERGLALRGVVLGGAWWADGPSTFS